MAHEREVPPQYLQRVGLLLALSAQQLLDFKAEIESLCRRGFTEDQAARHLKKQVRSWP